MKPRFSDHNLIAKLFFHLLPYQFLLLIIDAANGIVDSLCASNFIGKTAMSAIGFYSPLNHLLFAVSIMLVSGSQLLVGEAMGRNKTDSVRKLFSTDLLISLIVSLILAGGLILFAATDLTRIMVSNEAERSAMNLYIIGQSLGIPALVLGQQLFSFLSMENQRRLTMIASLVCFGVNTAMDFLLIRGFQMGTFGLGLGSAIALWVFFFTMAQFYMRGRSDISFSLRAFDRSLIGTIVKRGYPGAISRFVEMFRCIIVNMLILHFVGSTGLSAFAAVNAVMAVFWPFAFGMMAVTRMMLGISLGEEDRRSVTDIMRVLLIRGFLIQCAITAAIILLGSAFTGMFYHDAADPVYQMTLNGFRILPMCMPLSIISLGFASYGQAVKNRFFSIPLPILDGAVCVSAFSAALIPVLGMTGLYIANVINGVICVVVILIYSCVRNRHFPKNMEEFLVLPADIGEPEDCRIDIEVRSMEDVIRVSDQVTGFCRGHGVDDRRATFAALALEEMAGNVVDHGFTKDNRKHEIDIRVAYTEEYIMLRFTDNCRSFDPHTRLEQYHHGEDPCSGIGIRLVFNMAEDVQYQNLLGLNVLTIRV